MKVLIQRNDIIAIGKDLGNARWSKSSANHILHTNPIIALDIPWVTWHRNTQVGQSPQSHLSMINILHSGNQRLTRVFPSCDYWSIKQDGPWFCKIHTYALQIVHIKCRHSNLGSCFYPKFSVLVIPRLLGSFLPHNLEHYTLKKWSKIISFRQI